MVIEVIMKLTVVMQKAVDMGVNWEVDKELTNDVYNEIKCFTLMTY